MNFCTNAVQAMKRGGILRVILERAVVNKCRTLSRGSLAPGPYVRLIVSPAASASPSQRRKRMFYLIFMTGGTVD